MIASRTRGLTCSCAALDMIAVSDCFTWPMVCLLTRAIAFTLCVYRMVCEEIIYLSPHDPVREASEVGGVKDQSFYHILVLKPVDPRENKQIRWAPCSYLKQLGNWSWTSRVPLLRASNADDVRVTTTNGDSRGTPKCSCVHFPIWHHRRDPKPDTQVVGISPHGAINARGF